MIHPAENRGGHGGGRGQAHRDDHVTAGGEEADGAGGRGQARHRRGRAHVIGDDHATEVHLLAQQHPHRAGGKHREMAGVDPRVAGQGDHDERHARVDGGLEGPEVGVARGGHRVDDPGGDVGVARHPAQPGEMLGGGGHSGLPHPPDERHAVCRHGFRVTAELAQERAYRLVPRRGPGRDHVHDRGQVEVDAGQLQLASPRGGLPPQRAGGQFPLGHGRRDRREARTAQPLDLTALLVGGDEEPDPRCGRRGGQRLIGGGYLPDVGLAGGARGSEQQGAEVIGRDRAGDLVAGGVGDADQKQLAHPLGHGHPGEDPCRAGGRIWRRRRP
jgi:hypothetical protein